MRYLPQTAADRAAMLADIGVKTADDLYKDVPAGMLLTKPVNLPSHQGEYTVERTISALAAQNLHADGAPFFLGAGCYNHHIPSTVDYIIQRSEFLTAYTPYQPEIAQGTLMYLFEFQSYICNLTGMDVANASMYDGATSVAEAVLMAKRVTKRDNVTVVDGLHPQYLDVLKAYLTHSEGTITIGDKADDTTACVVVQTPNFYGEVVDLKPLRALCDKTGALLVVAINEIVSLGMLPAPKEADIVAGEAQSIGVPMSFGGPHLGFFACKEGYIRQMPGRLCGETLDADGKRGYVLTLSTREQHIRREKATSNICTNQGLCALAFTVHLSLLGEEGFKQLARLNHEAACDLADALAKVPGVKVLNKTFFNEFTVELPKNSADVVEALADIGIIGGLALDGNKLLVTATELTTPEHIAAFTAALKEVL
ncbi:MAG: aminomethyl-transferring glycine dehydrogenase subunit GcvPA [Proteobacteria bacterium]|nr:aminomethyl-transferring glycine dehydrogenase subunit GcvPA [Pseudomonadota bacterium]